MAKNTRTRLAHGGVWRLGASRRCASLIRSASPAIINALTVNPRIMQYALKLQF
jgi:hypothetical protein